MKSLLITIDGPAGAGKTTVSRALADRLGYAYVDTGALYRGVAWEADRQNIAADDDDALAVLCAGMDLRFIRDVRGTHLFSGNREITELIRTPDMSMKASAVSARPVVRRALLDIQRKLGAEKKAVFEGRDMGTVVFPDADIKFFLTADLKARALRRYKELAADLSQNLAEVEAEMNQRDVNDSSRTAAPLKPAEDAIIIDSTRQTVRDVTAAMIGHISDRFGPPAGLRHSE
jgi:CMP/dCMP kinase